MSCIKPTCTIVADAARCCNAAADAAKCDSIQNPTSFCASVGSSGLVANPGTVTCLTSTCSNTTDVDKCCKPCAAGRFLNWKTNVCDPCEIGQFSTVGSSACLSSCPAGYGADVTVPIYMNVFFMLDMTGSVCEQWVEEVETAEEYCTLLFLQYLIKLCGMCVLTLLFPLLPLFHRSIVHTVNAFKTEIANSPSTTINFNAGAITWGTTPSYLKDPAGDGTTDTTLRPDIQSLERAFVQAKSLEPSGVTNYGAPFTWFEHELKTRGAAVPATQGLYQAQRQLNFVIFLTDGLANDYQPDPTTGKDMPFGGDYSRRLAYAGDFGDAFCGNRGWCNALQNGCTNTGADASSTCSSANVIRAVKDIPGTTVVGIYVGDRKGEGPQVLHNVSSCDEYEFDPLNPMACPNTFSTSSFASLKPTVIPTVSKLMEKATGLQGICECCSAGSFSSENGARCQKCPVGTWGSGPCLTECSPCPTLTASTLTGLTDSSGCKQLCGALSSTQVTQLCSGQGYGNGLVAEAFSTAICSGATCNALGPSSPDASICCLPDAKCDSVTGSEITSMCKNHGGNVSCSCGSFCNTKTF